MATSLRRRLFARYYDEVTARYERLVQPRKRELFASLHGRVVEIGPGTGVNLSLYPPGIEWIGIEPNEAMHPLLLEKAHELGLEVDLRTLQAEQLPLEDSSVDAVVSTLVLCSVPNLSQVLSEIRRVLRPGGHYHFWEHVIAPEGRALRAVQHMISPLHRLCADGCRTDRDLASGLRAAHFADMQLEAFRVPSQAAPPWIRPHIRGIATN